MEKFKYKKGFWSASISWKPSYLNRRAFLNLISKNNETSIQNIELIKSAYGSELDEALARSDRPDLSIKSKYKAEIIKTIAGEFELQTILADCESYRIYSKNKFLIEKKFSFLIPSRRY